MLKRLVIFYVISALVIVRTMPTSYDGADDAARRAKSQYMRKYMNESADPCEDFYDFACGRWKLHHPANASQTQTSPIHVDFGDFNHKLSQLLMTPDGKETTAELKVKMFHKSCLGMTSLGPADYKEKLNAIVSEFGQMPALQANESVWQEDDFDWLKTIAEITHKYDIVIMFGSKIATDPKDRSAHSISLTSQRFKVLHDFSAIRDSYALKIAKNLQEFLDFEAERAQELTKEIVDFEALLWEASQESDRRYGYLTMADMQEIFQHYVDIGKLMNITYGFIPNEPIATEFIYIQSMLNIVENTPKKVVANYIFYYLMSEFMIKVPENSRELSAKCTKQTVKYFGKLVTSLFYRSQNLKEKERDFEHMWLSIKSTLQTILESSRIKWFNDEAREYSLEKLHSMKMLVPSYQDRHFDDLYQPLAISGHAYVENLKHAMAFNVGRTRASLDDGIEASDDVNMYSPFYDIQFNVIVVPVSMLSSDYFWSTRHPNALNFGRLGVMISHEVFHGFSGDGRLYDRWGFRKGSWDEVAESQVDDSRQCLFDQYHNYTVGGHHLPQEPSQSENAADNAGIVLAYESYLHWYEDSGRSKEELQLETLPNLDFNHKQLFFINYSQGWCEDTYEGERSSLAFSDEHSPFKFRAFVPILNFDEFASAFQCPRGQSAMNPAKKCKIL